VFGSWLSLSGCASQTVQGAYPSAHRTAQGASLGVVGGTIASTLANAPIPLGAAIGGTMGAAANGYYSTAAGLMEVLGQQGVQVIKYGSQVTLLVPTDSFFYLDSPKINPQVYAAMDNIAALLSKYPNSVVAIRAYSDNVNTSKRNLELSQNRADSVVAYLWTHGIPFQRLRATGYGEQQPIANNRKLNGSKANRRVEISFLTGAVG
jgi:outer membrane protein OmpA-like peptidoglycan-associated protein